MKACEPGTLLEVVGEEPVEVYASTNIDEIDDLLGYAHTGTIMLVLASVITVSHSPYLDGQNRSINWTYVVVSGNPPLTGWTFQPDLTRKVSFRG